MEKIGLPLHLNRNQARQWYAHTFTYTYYLLFQAQIRSERTTIDTITGIGSQLLSLCIQDDPAMLLTLDAEEVSAVKQMLRVLQEIYEAHSSEGQACLALEHLAMCRALLQQAEQGISEHTDGIQRQG